jgi:hypothetical protein
VDQNKPNQTQETGAEKSPFSRSELLAFLGICSTTLWKLERAGRIRAVPGLGRKLYPRAEIDRFLTLPRFSTQATAGGVR